MSRRSRAPEDQIELEGMANAKVLRHEWCQHVLKKQKKSHRGWNIVNKREWKEVLEQEGGTRLPSHSPLSQGRFCNNFTVVKYCSPSVGPLLCTEFEENQYALILIQRQSQRKVNYY